MRLGRERERGFCGKKDFGVMGKLREGEGARGKVKEGEEWQRDLRGLRRKRVKVKKRERKEGIGERRRKRRRRRKVKSEKMK